MSGFSQDRNVWAVGWKKASLLLRSGSVSQAHSWSVRKSDLGQPAWAAYRGLYRWHSQTQTGPSDTELSSIAADPQYEAIFEKANCFHWCDKEEIHVFQQQMGFIWLDWKKRREGGFPGFGRGSWAAKYGP